MHRHQIRHSKSRFAEVPSYLFGMYGTGFFVFCVITVFLFYRGKISSCLAKITLVEVILIFVLLWILAAAFLPALADSKRKLPKPTTLFVGVQMEFPSQAVIPQILNQALAKNTNAAIFVLSEYSLDGGVPDSLKNWCRDNSRFLVIGGKDFVTNDVYYNTAFVVGTNGEIVFKQAKSVPIQFFHDGLPAPKQEVWNSPWGKIGICICYDLSYTRVTDEHARHGRTRAARRATAHRADDGRGILGQTSARTAFARRAGARGGIWHPDFPCRQFRHFASRHRRRQCHRANEHRRQRRNLFRATALAAPRFNSN